MFKRRKPESQPEHTMDNEPSLDEPGATEGLLGGNLMASQSRMPYPGDNGLGVPPYRPAPSKEVPTMARTPFPVLTPTSGPTPGGSAPTLISPPRPGMQMGTQGPGMQGPGMQPGQQNGVHPVRVREASERRTLVVGRGISVQGTVADAERLVVEGTVEASMIHATELAIAQGGVFKGEVEVEDAEIAGLIDGTLTVRGNLIVRATGRVLGTARCRRLQVEDGGQITGRMEMLTEGASKPETPRAAEAVS